MPFSSWHSLSIPACLVRAGELRGALLRCLQDVARESPVMRALLDNDEASRPPHSFPNFGELRGEELPEDRADADTGEEIALAANRGTVFVIQERGKRVLSVAANGASISITRIRWRRSISARSSRCRSTSGKTFLTR